MCNGFAGILELSFRGVKAAIEDTVHEFDSGLVQAIHQEQNDRSHQQRPDPSGQRKGLLNDIEFLLELEDGDADEQGQCNQSRAVAKRDGYTHHAALPHCLRCEIDENSVRQI